VDDERVRERLRLRDPVGAERDDRRRLEHADPGRTRGEQVREAGCNDDEQAGHQREPEVEAEREAPEGRTEYHPGHERPEEGDQPDTPAPERDHSFRQVTDRRLDLRLGEERQPCQWAQADGNGALAVDAEDHDGDRHRKRQHDHEHAGRAEPRHFGHHRKHHEEQEEKGQNVEDPLDHNRPGSLDPRRPAEGPKGHDPGGISGAEREHAVQKLTQEERLGGRHPAGSRRRGEEAAPAEHPQEEGEHEQPEGRQQEPVVALAKRLAELVEVHVPDCEVAEGDSNGGRERSREAPAPAIAPCGLRHRAASAMQARS
jgi:hypothetical protein